MRLESADMKDRTKPLLVIAGAMFVVYAVCQFLFWLIGKSDRKSTFHLVVVIVELALIAVIAGVAGYRAMVRAPAVEGLPPLVVAIAIGCAASVVIGPFAGGGYPFGLGAGDFFLQIWLILGAGLLGMGLGALAAMAAGRDHRTRALKRYADAKLARPRRAVGR
jgi:hypothetical protein